MTIKAADGSLRYRPNHQQAPRTPRRRQHWPTPHKTIETPPQDLRHLLLHRSEIHNCQNRSTAAEPPTYQATTDDRRPT